MMRLKPIKYCSLGHRFFQVPYHRVAFRFYSDDTKYRSIEDFNKTKTDYNFNEQFDHLDQRSGKFNTNDIHAKVFEALDEEQKLDINSILETDPRLKNVDRNSPEYKDLLFQISKEYKQKEKTDSKKEQRNDRFKAIGAGLGIFSAIALTHQLIFNWEWYKIRFFKSWYKVDETKVKPPVNAKNIDYLASKLSDIINSKFISGLSKSDENAGLYVFGSQNGKKLPTRIPFFNDMILKDVKASNNLLVVVDDAGKLYQFTNKMKQPELIKLPFKVDKCEISPEFVYLLTNKGKLALTPRFDIEKSLEFESSVSRTWLGLSRLDNSNMIPFDLTRGEKIQDISGGYNHLLILTNNGRIFTMKTSEMGDNNGQFGLPQYSPINRPKIEINQPFELTLLNNEIEVTKAGKSLKPRFFTNIAAGNYHNIVSDSKGNIWTWGMNSYGQCGLDVSYKSNIQAVPIKVLNTEDFADICRKQITKVQADNFSIEGVFANEETSFIKLNYRSKDSNNDILLSFGNGVKGQLGINRFLHVSHKPSIIKSVMLNEFNEDTNQVEDIGIADFSTGKNHSFVKLDNYGQFKDILIFGDNESGQFGNNKLVKTAKPTSIPKLLEPADFDDNKVNQQLLKSIAKKVHAVDNRLQLNNKLKVKGGEVEQVIQATDDSSVIFYRRK